MYNWCIYFFLCLHIEIYMYKNIHIYVDMDISVPFYICIYRNDKTTSQRQEVDIEKKDYDI